MSGTSPTEQLVEDVAAIRFGTIAASTKRGNDLDADGELALNWW